MKTILLPALMFTISLNSFSFDARPWDPYNNPSIFPEVNTFTLASLPEQGESTKIPWTTYYWESHRGGIAYRWQTNDNAWDYKLETSLAKLKKMNQEDIDLLSPAEKFDIISGNYSYPTVRSERLRTSPSAPSWHGLCHTSAASTIMYDEPMKKRLTNADGVSITFYSSDIKALMAWHAHTFPPKTFFVGRRCNRTPLKNNPCWDINPGAFHLVLTNSIGLEGKPIILDHSSNAVVWNRAIYKYKSTITKKVSSQSQDLYYLETEVFFKPYTAPYRQAKPLETETFKYFYYLEVRRSDGEITGGEWLDVPPTPGQKIDTPDFVWRYRNLPIINQSHKWLYQLFN